MKPRYIFSVIFIFASFSVQAQILQKKITLNYTDISIEEILNKITLNYKIDFSYSKDVISINRKVTVDFVNISLEEALKLIFKNTDITFNVIGEQVVLRKTEHLEKVKTSLHLEGNVTDKISGMPLQFATVSFVKNHIGIITNEEGDFILNYPIAYKDDSLNFSFIGYKSQKIPLKDITTHTLSILLEPDLFELQEVEIKPQSALSILKTAIAKIGDNYSLLPYKQNFYLRDWTWLEGEPIQVSESIYEAYRGEANQKEVKRQIRLLQARKMHYDNKYKSVLKAFPSLNSFDMGMNAYSISISDLTKFLTDDSQFLGKNGLSQHEFTLSENTYFDGREVYVINYDQKERNKSLWKGTFYIDINSLAFIKIVQNRSPKGLGHATFMGPKVLEKIFGLGEVKVTDQSFTIQYKEINGKWYLDHLFQNQELYLIKSKRKFNQLAKSKSDIVVTETETENVIPIQDSLISSARSLLYRQYGDLDQSFWQNQNIIKPDKNFNNAFKRISLKTGNENISESKTAEGGLDDNDNGTAELNYIDLDLTKKTKHFTFTFSQYDTSIIDELEKKLEDNYGRIITDLKVKKMPLIEVRVYPSIKTYHTAINNPNAPDWMAGSAGINEINMVSPLNPGSVHSSNPQIIDCIVHEFAHCVHIHMMNNNLGSVKNNDTEWLWEAIACYETYASIDSLTLLSQVRKLDYLKTSKYPTLTELNDTGGNGKIYDLGYYLIDYIKTNWGMKSIIKLMKTNGDLEKVLHLNEKKFEEGFYNFLKEKYGV